MSYRRSRHSTRQTVTFLECTGELHIFIYREEKTAQQKKHTPPLTQKEVRGIYQSPLEPTGCQGQVATKERETNRLLLGKNDQLLELSCSSHTPHSHLFLKVLLSISERRGAIKDTFVTLNPKCPSTQNHNTVKPLFPCLFYLLTCLPPPICKSQFIVSGCNSFKTKAF